MTEAEQDLNQDLHHLMAVAPIPKREVRSSLSPERLKGSYVKRPNYIRPDQNLTQILEKQRIQRKKKESGSMSPIEVKPPRPNTVITNFNRALQKGKYKCPMTGSRFIFGELGMKLLAAQHVKERWENLDEGFCGVTHHTYNFDNDWDIDKEVFATEANQLLAIDE